MSIVVKTNYRRGMLAALPPFFHRPFHQAATERARMAEGRRANHSASPYFPRSFHCLTLFLTQTSPRKLFTWACVCNLRDAVIKTLKEERICKDVLNFLINT